MKKQNVPIEIKYEGVTEYVYYRDSDLLDKLDLLSNCTHFNFTLVFNWLSICCSLLIKLQNKIGCGQEWLKKQPIKLEHHLSSLLGWIEILKS